MQQEASVLWLMDDKQKLWLQADHATCCSCSVQQPDLGGPCNSKALQQHAFDLLYAPDHGILAQRLSVCVLRLCQCVAQEEMAPCFAKGFTCDHGGQMLQHNIGHLHPIHIHRRPSLNVPFLGENRTIDILLETNKQCGGEITAHHVT